MPKSIGDLKPEFVPELLMRKYSLLKQEVWHDMETQRQHIKYLYLLLTALFALYSASFASPPNSSISNVFNSLGFLTILSVVVGIVVNYIGYHVLDGIYSMTLVSARIAVIEQKINTMAGETLLCWESSDKIRDMFNVGMPFRWFVNPLRVLGVFQAVVSILLLLCVPSYALAHLSVGQIFAFDSSSVFFWVVQLICLGCLLLFWFIAITVIGHARTEAFNQMATLDYREFTLQLPPSQDQRASGSAND